MEFGIERRQETVRSNEAAAAAAVQRLLDEVYVQDAVGAERNLLQSLDFCCHASRPDGQKYT